MGRHKQYDVQEQLKQLDWKKGCKCSWQVNCYGLVIKGENSECRSHDKPTFWQKIKIYLKRIIPFGQ